MNILIKEQAKNYHQSMSKINYPSPDVCGFYYQEDQQEWIGFRQDEEASFETEREAIAFATGQVLCENCGAMHAKRNSISFCRGCYLDWQHEKI